MSLSPVYLKSFSDGKSKLIFDRKPDEAAIEAARKHHITSAPFTTLTAFRDALQEVTDRHIDDEFYDYIFDGVAEQLEILERETTHLRDKRQQWNITPDAPNVSNIQASILIRIIRRIDKAKWTLYRYLVEFERGLFDLYDFPSPELDRIDSTLLTFY